MSKNISCVVGPMKAEKQLSCCHRLRACEPTLDLVCVSDSLAKTRTWQSLKQQLTNEYTLVYTGQHDFRLHAYAVERLKSVSDSTQAKMVYANYFEEQDGSRLAFPLIPYQTGSLRDDFNFGKLLFFNTEDLLCAIDQMTGDYAFAALYELCLLLSKDEGIFHLPEYLYTDQIDLEAKRGGEHIFDYVDPRNRAVQVEMEQVCTTHLKSIGAYLAPNFKKLVFTEENFANEASVIIPVYNRVKTIKDALNSALQQKVPFNFNVIVVDNHSTDGTSEILHAMKDPRLIHLIPGSTDLGIGGCWNLALMDPRCGKFAVQLDSDDLYVDAYVLERIVNTFYDHSCAMVVGSYKTVNFDLEEIAPGLVDHKEWTIDNGRNNALRINGLGAPRAFYTPLLRELKLPNTSYGEDYAIGLRICREYAIGRIYDNLYLCRRWGENSDACLDIHKSNEHNYYKDKLRSMELKARQTMVKGTEKR